MKVTLTIQGDEKDGKTFEFTEMGSLLFGRSTKAQCQIQKDPYVSRSHFLLIVNPSDVRLRNLSRTNGTEADGVLYTQARQAVEDSEAQTMIKGDDTDEPAEAILHDGSQIECGYTRITVSVQEDDVADDVDEADALPDVFCGHCGARIPGRESKAAHRDGCFVCPACRGKGPAAPQPIVGGRPRRPPAVPRPQPRPRQPARRPGQADQLMEDVLRRLGIPKPAGRIPEIPGYSILGRLSGGGMGVIFRGVRLSDDRPVALKMVRPDRRISSSARSRFKRERTIARRLKHDHIIDTFDGGEVNGLLWMAMEYIDEGYDVEKHIARSGGRIPQREAVTLILQALEALTFAFEQEGIVHRDIKPPNILLKSAGSAYTAKLSDFGLAKSLEDAGLNESMVTKEGTCMGTVPYMPPEQVIDVRTATPAADVFSMGATLYQMLTGNLVRNFPARMKPENEVLRQIVDEPVIPVEKRDRSIDRRLACAVNRSLELDPADRYPDAVTFAEALRKAMR